MRILGRSSRRAPSLFVFLLAAGCASGPPAGASTADDALVARPAAPREMECDVSFDADDPAAAQPLEHDLPRACTRIRFFVRARPAKLVDMRLDGGAVRANELTLRDARSSEPLEYPGIAGAYRIQIVGDGALEIDVANAGTKDVAYHFSAASYGPGVDLCEDIDCLVLSP